jgi:hypothetical protein
MRRTVLIAALLFASPLLAQDSETRTYLPPGAPAMVYTPEIQLGSATVPSTVTVPPIEQIIPNASEYVSNAPPASTALLSMRHFDFVVAPMRQALPGSMEDTSISLGEYARQLRAEKQKSLLNPDAIAQPANPK